MRPGRMPRKYTIITLNHPTTGGFNEAGADAPEIRHKGVFECLA